MTTRRLFLESALTLAALPLVTAGQTCSPAAKPAKHEKPAACAAKLSASGGATLVTCGEKKSTFKVKCTKCGFQTAEIEIDTPTADKPYTLEWKCPKCGQKHSVTIAPPKA